MYIYVYVCGYIYIYIYTYMCTHMYIISVFYVYLYLHLDLVLHLDIDVYAFFEMRPSYEQTLVCLSNRETVDASRGWTSHCEMANNRFFSNCFGLI